MIDQKSIAAAGAAGAIVMTFTNSLALALPLPAIWIALALSCLAAIGGMSKPMNDEPVTRRWILCLFSALTIFSAATGTNQLGGKVGGVAPAHASDEQVTVAWRCYDAEGMLVRCDSEVVVRHEMVKLKPRTPRPESPAEQFFKPW